MQTLTRPSIPLPSIRPPRRRRRKFPSYMLIGVAITILLLSGAGIYAFINNRTATTLADGDNMDCTLVVPPNPLTAQGLATPYQLKATDSDNGPCHEANKNQAAFVQGAIFDPATNQISVYNPLVIDKGTKPAAAPVVPKLPADAVVALWFGFNGNNLTLQSSHNSLQEGRCVNGVKGSIFTQFAYCNAPYFFSLTSMAMKEGKLNVPSLGTAKDGQTCPTVRDFSVVDQDQSDNVTTGYLVTNKGRIAQLTKTNLAELPDARALTNGSDNGLLDAFIDPALGCHPWMVPDLADPGQVATALPLDELQADAHQAAPVALVPANDPMVLKNTKIDIDKVNAYRVGVDQPWASSQSQADPKAYCQNLADTGASRIIKDATFTAQRTSPDPAMGNNLFTFLGQRFAASYVNLNCKHYLGKKSPIAVKVNGDGVAVKVVFKGEAVHPGDSNSSDNNGSSSDSHKSNNNGNSTDSHKNKSNQVQHANIMM
jgi:hypothetical protein